MRKSSPFSRNNLFKASCIHDPAEEAVEAVADSEGVVGNEVVAVVEVIVGAEPVPDAKISGGADELAGAEAAAPSGKLAEVEALALSEAVVTVGGSDGLAPPSWRGCSGGTKLVRLEVDRSERPEGDRLSTVFNPLCKRLPLPLLSIAGSMVRDKKESG